MFRGKFTLLKPLEARDLENYRTWINDPEVARLVLGSTDLDTRNRALTALKENTGSRDCHCDFMIKTIGTEKSIGFCCLRNIHTIHRSAEIEQFFIAKEEHRNKGYGQDSLQILLKYVFRSLNLHKIWLIIYASNRKALQFYQRGGFIQEGRLREIQFSSGHYWDGILMGVLRKEWRERRSKK